MFLFLKLADLKEEVVLQFSELFAIVSVKFALKNFKQITKLKHVQYKSSQGSIGKRAASASTCGPCGFL